MIESPFHPTTPDEDAQLVVGTLCLACGEPIQSIDDVGMVAPKGRTAGPFGIHRICMQLESTPVPAGMDGGPVVPDEG